jgi:hypothetical protein
LKREQRASGRLSLAAYFILLRRKKTRRREPAASAVTASAALAHFPLNRFQPFSESAIYGAGFSRRDSSCGDFGQYPALKRCDLV